MENRCAVNCSLLGVGTWRIALQQTRGAREGELGMIANQDWVGTLDRGGESSSNHRAGLGLQSRGKMFFIFDKHEIVGGCRQDAGDPAYSHSRIAQQSRSYRIRNLL